jgi:hypothetical protein
MPTYRGTIKRVGAEGGSWVATSGSTVPLARRKVSVIEIGETELRDVSCSPELQEVLVPGREAELYVHRLFFRTPCVIGVRHVDDGRTYPAGFGEFLAVLSAYLLFYPLIIIALGALGGLLLSLAAGERAGTRWSALVIAAALGWSVVKAVLLVRRYLLLAAT